MNISKTQIKKILPLYSDLADLLLEFLEPCLDYDVLKCTHKNAFCRCGNIFEFHSSRSGDGEKILLENFCPFCGRANPHKSRIRDDGYFLMRAKKYLRCPQCFKRAESYDHQFCSVCQHKLAMIVQ